jgi:hypothetical protein
MSKAKWSQARGVWNRKINPLRKQGFVEIPPGHPALTAQAAAEAVNLIAKRNEKYVFLEAWRPGDEGYEGAIWMAQRWPSDYTVYVSPASAFYAEARRLNEEHRRQQAAQQAAEAAEKARLLAETEGFARELLRLLPPEWKVTGHCWPDSAYTRLFLHAPDGRDAIALIRPSGYALSTPGAVAERLLAAYASPAPILYA